MSGEVKDIGKAQAAVAYLSLFTWLPLFLWPLLVRDDEFGLAHGKWAGALYVGLWATIMFLVIFSSITCGIGGILFPIVLGWWIPMGLGLLKVINELEEPPVLAEPLASKLFGSLEVKGQIE